MTAQRNIEKLLSIFDLRIGKAICQDNSVSTRAMLIYDKNQNKKEFMLLNKDLAEEDCRKIALWLERNMEVSDIIPHLGSREIDMDRFSKVCCGSNW